MGGGGVSLLTLPKCVKCTRQNWKWKINKNVFKLIRSNLWSVIENRDQNIKKWAKVNEMSFDWLIGVLVVMAVFQPFNAIIKKANRQSCFDRKVSLSFWILFFQSGRDKKGAAIALFTARIHQPSLTSHQLVLKALVYQLDAALER